MAGRGSPLLAGVVALTLSGHAPVAAEEQWDFVSASDRFIVAAIIGAADGLMEAASLSDDLSLRVDAIRKHGPDVGNPDTDPINESLISVRDAAHISALSGEWSEDALDGYLQVMEAGYEVRTEAAMAAFPIGSGTPINLDSATSALSAMPLGFSGSGAPFAIEAMSKIAVLEKAVDIFLAEIPDTRDDVITDDSFVSLDESGYREFLYWSLSFARLSEAPSVNSSPSPI